MIIRHIQVVRVLLAACFVWVAACESSNRVLPEEVDGCQAPQLEFQVFSQTGTLGTNATNPNEEFNIQELYIYAFDDFHTRPDFFQDVFINEGQGSNRSYKVKMNINGLGMKRFYLIANPPQYIKEQLTYDCTEGELKTMGIALQKPLNDIKKLPQDADGISFPDNPNGFPMANQFTAVVQEGKLKGQLMLTATDNTSDQAITQIPIFRSLGKVTVTIKKKEAQQDGVAIKSLRIFNYTCNGDVMPQWNIPPHENSWTANGSWNAHLTLDLEKMKLNETIVGVEPVPLIQQEKWVDSTHPILLTSFYLCQNSFGNKKLPHDTQTGLEDPVGNRTTKLAIELSDGRKSEVDFPFLRRNDHLKVNIVISRNIILVTFLPWVLSEVTPDWNEDIVAPPVPPVVHSPANVNQ